MSAISLWPKDFGKVDVKTPVSILREQANALGESTSNVVVGRVFAGTGPKDYFRHVFEIACPPLGYRSALLLIDHKVDMYPVTIHVETDGVAKLITADTPGAFMDALRTVFNSDSTRRLIASLIAQSQA